jgi:hypothetical protein
LSITEIVQKEPQRSTLHFPSPYDRWAPATVLGKPRQHSEEARQLAATAEENTTNGQRPACRDDAVAADAPPRPRVLLAAAGAPRRPLHPHPGPPGPRPRSGRPPPRAPPRPPGRHHHHHLARRRQGTYPPAFLAPTFSPVAAPFRVGVMFVDLPCLPAGLLARK